MRRSALALLPLVAIAIAGCGQDHPAGGGTRGSSDDEVVLTPQAAEAARKQAKKDEQAANAHAKVVQLQGAGDKPQVSGNPEDSGPSPGAASDAEVRAELKEARAELKSFSAHLTTADL